MKKKIKMKSGHPDFYCNDPAIFITGTGRHTYLWVGNDSIMDKRCFSTISGEKTLERFAVNILKSLKSKHLIKQ